MLNLRNISFGDVFASVVCVALLSVLIAFSIEILMSLFLYIGKHAIRAFRNRKNAKLERNNSQIFAICMYKFSSPLKNLQKSFIFALTVYDNTVQCFSLVKVLDKLSINFPVHVISKLKHLFRFSKHILLFCYTFVLPCTN